MIKKIREPCNNNFVHLAVDETTHGCGHFAANFLVEQLNSEQASVNHL